MLFWKIRTEKLSEKLNPHVWVYVCVYTEQFIDLPEFIGGHEFCAQKFFGVTQKWKHTHICTHATNGIAEEKKKKRTKIENYEKSQW